MRQGNFVGAAVNTVTRSGTNVFHGSFSHAWRDESLVGTKAAGATFNPGTFTYRNTGGWASGPVVKNRAFFFGSYENEKLTSRARRSARTGRRAGRWQRHARARLGPQ